MIERLPRLGDDSKKRHAEGGYYERTRREHRGEMITAQRAKSAFLTEGAKLNLAMLGEHKTGTE